MRSVLLVVLLASACGEVAPRSADGGGDGDGPVTITFTNQLATTQPANAGLVAFQDGDGPWQVVTGTSGVYKFSVASGRYGVLAACERTRDSSTFVTLAFFAVSDGLEHFAIDFCTVGTPLTVMISGSVAGTAMGDSLWISDGIYASAGLVTSWEMPAVEGPGTLIGMRMSGERPTAMVLQRVAFSAGAVFTVDFANQFFPAESDLTMDPTGGSTPTMETEYIDESGGNHRIDFARTQVNKYRVVPADRAGNGMTLLSQISSANGVSRTVQRAFRSPRAQTLTLPAAYLLPRPPEIVTRTPYPIVETTLPRRGDASYYLVSYFTSLDNRFHSWEVTYSAAWVNAKDGNELVSRIPDFSMLGGWKASFALTVPGGSWNVIVGSGPLRLLPGVTRYGIQGRSTAMRQEGDEVTTAGSSGSFP